VNIEARINKDGRFYIMEIGPRSGGSLTPQTIYYSSGFDMLGASFDLLMGIPLNIPAEPAKPAICFTLHVNQDGKFNGIQLDKDLMPYVVEEHIFVNPGDLIKSYRNEGSTLGVYIFRFDSMEQLNPLLAGFYDKVVQSVILV
jgi:biotin carboxylase